MAKIPRDTAICLDLGQVAACGSGMRYTGDLWLRGGLGWFFHSTTGNRRDRLVSTRKGCASGWISLLSPGTAPTSGERKAGNGCNADPDAHKPAGLVTPDKATVQLPGGAMKMKAKDLRGRIRVLDKPGLRKRSCECYAVVKGETDRLMSYNFV